MDTTRPERPQSATRSSTLERLTDRELLVPFALCLAIVAAFIPVAMAMDSHVDRQRPMYADVWTVAYLEYQQIQLHGHAKPLHLADGEKVTLGGEKFTPAGGTTVEVKLDGDGYCIQATDEHQDSTAWKCYDGTTNPGNPDGS